MNDKQDMFKRIFWHSPIRYVVAFLICVVITLVYLLVQSGWNTIFGWGNGLSVGGAVCFLFGLLVLVAQLGTFDIFGYAFSSFRGANRKYKTLYDYSEDKRIVRKKTIYNFVPYLIVGLIFLVTGLILLATI